MRPRGAEYQRYIHLVELYRDCGWQPAAMLARAPFRVADVGTNAILLRAERDLAAMAARFGQAAEAVEIAARIARLERGLAGLWSEAHGVFLSRDLIAEAPIAVATSAGLMPLFGQAATPAQVAAIAATLRRWGGMVTHPVPSTAPDDPRFEPRRYWRGPIWAMVNWMIAEGLAASGEPTLAASLHDATRALIAAGGFSEYFDPTDGAGIGGANFSWTAAICLLLGSPAAAPA
jgi:glycogen debranching enzyme